MVSYNIKATCFAKVRIMFDQKLALSVLTGVSFCVISGCEQENVVYIGEPSGFPIVLEYPEEAEQIVGDDNSVHFLIEESRISLFLTTDDLLPEIVKRARAADVTEIEGETIVEDAVSFGDVSGTRWRLSPSKTTYYLLDAPGNHVGIAVTQADDDLLESLEGSLRTLKVEHLP